MAKLFKQIALVAFFFSTAAYAIQRDAAQSQNDARSFIENLFKDNAQHLQEASHEDFKTFADMQSPRATIVACSDSRVQTPAFHQNPINDLFTVRNVGNQIITSQGSVEYGIYHLNTPVLLIMGHSNCGAIQAALGNYSQERAPIVKELDSLHLPKSTEVNAGVIENVHQQVKYALDKYQDRIEKNQLYVVGMIYDFTGDYKKGQGRLLLINLNGEKDKHKIQEHALIKGLNEISVGLE